MSRLPLLAAVALAPAMAVSPDILGRDDLDFARRLADAGYSDLARMVCDAVVARAEANGASTGPEAVAARILAFEAETAEARDLDDLAAREARLTDVLSRGEAFAKTLPQGPDADRLDAALATAQEEYAMILLERVQAEQDTAALARIRKQADDVFRRAIDSLTKRIQSNEKDRGSVETDEELAALDRKLIVDMYSRARMYYLHSLLLPADDNRRELVLDDALAAFQAFDFSYGRELLSFEGNIFQGLCYKALEQDDAALEAFDYAISLREGFDPGPDGLRVLPPDAANVVSSAVFQKVQFQRELKDFAGAAATAQDFLDTVSDPLKADQGLPILAAQAEALGEAGDVPGSLAAAQALVAADPRGAWGARGREILANSASLGSAGSAQAPPPVLLRIAETLFAKGEALRGHQTCAQARHGARRTATEQDIGAESFVLEGDAYAREGNIWDACVAWEAAALLYPQGVRAPDGLWSAINGYSDLYASEQLAWFRRAAQERLDLLSSSYSKHPLMAQAALIEGQWAEADRDYTKAAAVYAKVAPGSPAYGPAQRRAGANLLLQAKAQDDAKKPAEAAKLRTQARQVLEVARKELELRMGETLDKTARLRLSGLAFGARADIARLLLAGTPQDVAAVIPLLADVETVHAGEEDKLAETWRLRIKALELQGKLDEAVTMLDGLVQKSPDAAAIGPAAGSLARALDRAANELHEKTPGSTQAVSQWKQAARLYGLSVKPQLAGGARRDRAELEAVGTRLLALALTLEGAPEGSDSFLDWQPTALARPELWDQVRSILQAVLDSGGNYRAEILLGRVLAFQGDWRDAAQTYSRMFDHEELMDISGKRMDVGRIREKPELVPAYVEWATAESMAGSTGDDRERLSRAADLLTKALPNLDRWSKLWWRAKTQQIQNLMWQGRYDEADIALRELERTTDDYDKGEFGAREKLLALKAEVATKVIRN